MASGHCLPIAAASNSDLLIALEGDGKHYIAQHTLWTNEELLVLELPSERTPVSVKFQGPEAVTFETGHQHNPDTVSLWSGGVIARYRHHYDLNELSPDNSLIELTITDEHYTVSSENMQTLHSTLTWILPPEAMLISYGQTNLNAAETGNWTHQDNIVSYTQSSGELPNLTLQYSINLPEPEVIIDPCVAVIGPSDECSPDTDQDGIPDYRDICLGVSNKTTTATAPPENQLGCDSQQIVVLEGVSFEVGNSYLNTAARDVLDRVAIALQRTDKPLFEVAAYTDNAGSDKQNQRLSESRAAAVRHYLMLRGVGPNQLKATGYGERFPVSRNNTVQGRRDNRRIELKQLN